MEQRVALRNADRTPLFVERWIANRQFLEQVLPLMLDLAGRDENGPFDSHTSDLAAVEAIASSRCFGMNGSQVGADRRARRRVKAKAFELRVMSIAARVPGQHRAGEQRFPPQGDEALGIEVAGMQ